jgi:hypothetical protein
MRNYAKTKARPSDFLFFDSDDIPILMQRNPKCWSTFLPVEGFHTIGQTIARDQPDTP